MLQGMAILNLSFSEEEQPIIDFLVENIRWRVEEREIRLPDEMDRDEVLRLVRELHESIRAWKRYED